MQRLSRICVSSLVISSLLLLGQGTSSASLPSPFEIQMKLAKKVTFGSATKIAVPNCKMTKDYKTTCTFATIVVTVKSFKFLDLKGWPEGSATYSLDLAMANYSKQVSGVKIDTLLRCKNSRESASFYSSGIDPQEIPGGSQDGGLVVLSFPRDVTPTTCLLPTIWIEVKNGVDLTDLPTLALAKKKKLVVAAYIPLSVKDVAIA